MMVVEGGGGGGGVSISDIQYQKTCVTLYLLLK